MKTKAEIEHFIKQRVAELLRMEPEDIRTDVPLDDHYGLESIDVLTLGGHLEDWLGTALDMELMFENRTIEGLASAVAQQAKPV